MYILYAKSVHFICKNCTFCVQKMCILYVKNVYIIYKKMYILYAKNVHFFTHKIYEFI